MVRRLGLVELLEFNASLLPPISRGEHLRGPFLHAEQLAEQWTVDGDRSVPLELAFRLLDVETIAGAIWRTLRERDYRGDPSHWHFPPLRDLLPELRDVVWHDMLEGRLWTEAQKGVRGKRFHAVLPAELARLKPDWRASRLMLDETDVFVAVHVRRPPLEPIKKAWRKHPTPIELEAAMKRIAERYPPGVQPTQDELLKELRADLGSNVTRDEMREALSRYATHLLRPRGRPTKNRKPPSAD